MYVVVVELKRHIHTTELYWELFGKKIISSNNSQYQPVIKLNLYNQKYPDRR